MLPFIAFPLPFEGMNRLRVMLKKRLNTRASISPSIMMIAPANKVRISRAVLAMSFAVKYLNILWPLQLDGKVPSIVNYQRGMRGNKDIETCQLSYVL